MKTYNLINSVKGGCGKTTFSIWLAYYLSKKNHRNQIGKSGILDMDLLGTSMLAVFWGSNTKDVVEKELGDAEFINNVFHNNQYTSTYLNTVSLKNKIKLNVVFASIDSGDKKKFKVGGHSNYSPVIKYSTFRAGLKMLLTKNEAINELEFIIMDMPPNSDGFSEAAMECIFNKHYQVTEDDDKRNLFFMVGPDYGHTVATINDLEEIINKRDERFPDKIIIIFNDNLCSKVSEDVMRRRMEEFKLRINKMGLTEEEKDKIIFMIMNPNEKYAQSSFEGNGLCNLTASEIEDSFPECPVYKYATYDNDVFSQISDDEFLYLLCGKEK